MNRRCRVCQDLETDEFISIFGSKEGNLISDMLTATTGVVIDEYDRLPQHICQQCLNRLTQIHSIRKRYSSLHLLPKCQKGQEDDYHRCRVCGEIEVEELLSLRCVYAEEKLKIQDVIRLTTGVTILPGDGLPPYICNICLDALALWYEFKKQLLRSAKDLLEQALFAWEKMEYEPTRPGHLVVDLCADVIFSRKNGVTLHCSVCKLTMPWEQLGEECEGCLLQFRNIKAIREGVLESGLLSSRNHDPEESTNAEMLSEASTLEPSASIETESPAPTPKVYQPLDSKASRLFEVVEAYDDGPYYRVRRKGPTCCGCDVFFQTEKELSEHLQLKHSQDAGKASFKCDKCNSGFSQNWCCVAHISKLKQDTYYYCSECNLIMFNWRLFTDHKATHLTVQQQEAASSKFVSESSTIYTCCVERCEERWSNEQQLLEHCNKVHNSEMDSNKMVCRYCRKKFYNYNRFERHMDRKKVIQTFVCQIDDCTFKTNRESLIYLHCSQKPHINANRRQRSLDKTFVPDLKHFDVIGSADDNTDILETKSVMCCGCSDFFENQEELEKHRNEQHSAVEGDYPVRCPQCNKGFRLKADLTRHDKKATNRNYYYCRPCKIFQWTYNSFKHHKADAHMNVEEAAATGQFTIYSTDSYICCGCFQQFSEEEELVKHRRVSHPANNSKSDFTCNLCNRGYLYISGLKRHQELFSSKEVYKCKMSDCIFETKDLSRMKFHAANTMHKNPKGKTQNLYNPNPSIYRCCSYGCEFKCVSYDEMIKHGVKRHEEQRQRFAAAYGHQQIKCRVCLKGFDQEFQLLNHRNGRPKLLCKYCQEMFPIKDFDAHFEKCKLVPKIRCEKCPQQFVNKLLVEKHVKKCHNSSKAKYHTMDLCSVCGATMGKHKLKTHMRSHENRRLYKCKLCPKSFNHESMFIKHALVHTGEKPYPCRQGCEKRYKSQGDRDRHEKLVHLGITPFRCLLCPKAFVRERDLRLHQRVHTGMKLFHCKFCNEGFDVLKLLKEHMESCVQAVE